MSSENIIDNAKDYGDYTKRTDENFMMRLFAVHHKILDNGSSVTSAVQQGFNPVAANQPKITLNPEGK